MSLLVCILSVFTFFQSGSEKFEALLADMRAAQHSIHAEYFIFANDSIGSEVLSVMVQKAAQGVEAQLLIDGYYDRKRGYNYASRLDSLRALGLDVRLYDPYRFPYFNHALRDHRKIVVIDDSIAYTGGFNVADYNIQGKPGIYGAYIDTHVRLVGEGVAQLQQVFAQHFNALAHSPSSTSRRVPEVPAASPEPGVGVQALVRSHASRAAQRQMRDSIAALINAAHDSLLITSPYFLPPLGIRKALKRALQRGVKVSVMFSNTGDTPLLDHANKHYALKLVRQGAQVWLYQDGFLHSKVLTADGEVALVGSANLDCRALRFNEEVAVLIRHPEAAAWLDSAYLQHQTASVQLTPATYRKMSARRRILGFIADNLLYWGL